MRVSFRCLQEVLARLQIESQLKAINELLAGAGVWKVVSSGTGGEESLLEADYKLKNFSKTWIFLNNVAAAAHTSKHHPTITTTYNKVNFSLTTHDAGNQVTRKDLRLAQQIQNIYVDQTEKTPISSSDFFTEARNMADRTKVTDVIDKLTKRKL